jgi:hypothetical protein
VGQRTHEHVQAQFFADPGDGTNGRIETGHTPAAISHATQKTSPPTTEIEQSAAANPFEIAPPFGGVSTGQP